MHTKKLGWRHIRTTKAFFMKSIFNKLSQLCITIAGGFRKRKYNVEILWYPKVEEKCSQNLTFKPDYVAVAFVERAIRK